MPRRKTYLTEAGGKDTHYDELFALIFGCALLVAALQLSETPSPGKIVGGASGKCRNKILVPGREIFCGAKLPVRIESLIIQSVPMVLDPIVHRQFNTHIKLPHLVFFLVAAMPLAAAEKADITLNDGKLLRGARIISINDAEVTIVYSGGMATFSPDLVPLEALARAMPEIKARESARAKKTTEMVNADAKRGSVGKPEVADNSKRADVIGKSLAARQLSPLPSQKKLIDLKQGFPPQKKMTFKKGRNSYEFMVPMDEIYSHYRGYVQVATLDSIDQVVRRIEERATLDISSLRKRSHESFTASHSESEKFKQTADWLEGPFRAYLQSVKSLAK